METFLEDPFETVTVRMHVKINTLCEHWLPHPGKKSRHMLHLLCHQGPLGSICLQQDSDHVCLWSGYHTTMDVNVCSVDMVGVIFWSVLAQDTSGFIVWGHQLQLPVKYGVPAGYRKRVPATLLLPFIRQGGDVLFLQDNTCPHMAAAMQCALRGVQQLPWPTRTPDLSSIEHVWDIMMWELSLSQEPATTIAELRQEVQVPWNNLLQDNIQHLYDHLHVTINACFAVRGDYTVY